MKLLWLLALPIVFFVGVAGGRAFADMAITSSVWWKESLGITALFFTVVALLGGIAGILMLAFGLKLP